MVRDIEPLIDHDSVTGDYKGCGLTDHSNWNCQCHLFKDVFYVQNYSSNIVFTLTQSESFVEVVIKKMGFLVSVVVVPYIKYNKC